MQSPSKIPFMCSLLSLFLLIPCVGFADTVLVPRGSCESAGTLARIEVPRSYLECHTDADCSLSKEGCRSCNCPIAARQEHLATITALDNAQRVKSGNIRTCEACAAGSFKARCVNGLCETAANN